MEGNQYTSAEYLSAIVDLVDDLTQGLLTMTEFTVKRDLVRERY
jgi:hypothetical protein